MLVLRERGSGAEHRLATESAVSWGEGPVSVSGTARLDPATARDGAPLGDGVWDLSVRLTALGWTKNARLGALRGPAVPPRPEPVPHPTSPDRRVIPYWTETHGELSLRVAKPKPPAAPGQPAGGRRAGAGSLRRLVGKLRHG